MAWFLCSTSLEMSDTSMFLATSQDIWEAIKQTFPIVMQPKFMKQRLSSLPPNKIIHEKGLWQEMGYCSIIPTNQQH